MEFRISPTFECDCTADTTLIEAEKIKIGRVDIDYIFFYFTLKILIKTNHRIY